MIETRSMILAGKRMRGVAGVLLKQIGRSATSQQDHRDDAYNYGAKCNHSTVSFAKDGDRRHA